MTIVHRYQLDTIKSQFWEIQLIENGNGTFTYWSCHMKRKNFDIIKETEKLISESEYNELLAKYAPYLIEKRILTELNK